MGTQLHTCTPLLYFKLMPTYPTPDETWHHISESCSRNDTKRNTNQCHVIKFVVNVFREHDVYCSDRLEMKNKINGMLCIVADMIWKIAVMTRPHFSF